MLLFRTVNIVTDFVLVFLAGERAVGAGDSDGGGEAGRGAVHGGGGAA